MKAPSLASEKNLFLVVMAGGSGTRFWPKSTTSRPKQLLSFGNSKETLLQQTLSRFENWIPASQQIVVTTEHLKTSVKQQIHKECSVLAEPEPRNTAPCLFWAAKWIEENHKDIKQPIMLVMPSDHFISNVSQFLQTLSGAIEHTEKSEDLITIGVKPTRPETGYGYLELGETIPKKTPCFQVKRFVEKPSLSQAENYFRSEKYLWNGGMFVWKVKTLLQAYSQFLPEMEAVWKKEKGEIKKVYPLLPALSVDYGIMEKARSIVTFPFEGGWDDLGSWIALENWASEWGLRQGSNTVSNTQMVSVDSTGNIVEVPHHIVALLGIENLIVTQHGKVLMIAAKSKTQDLRKLVEEVKKTHPEIL